MLFKGVNCFILIFMCEVIISLYI